MGCCFAGDEVSGDNADGLHVHYILLEQTHHDQNYLMMVNKRREESEKNFLSQSSDESDSDETDSEYDRDFPIPEDNPFGCCKTNLYFDRSDVPLLNTIFFDDRQTVSVK